MPAPMVWPCMLSTISFNNVFTTPHYHIAKELTTGSCCNFVSDLVSSPIAHWNSGSFDHASSIDIGPCYEELKAEISAPAALITTLIGKKDKESSEATMCLCSLIDEVYCKVLPEKYKCPTFMKFDGDPHHNFQDRVRHNCNKWKAKAPTVPASLSNNTLRWFNNHPHGSISSWEELVKWFATHF